MKQMTATKLPTYYLLKKKAKAVSGDNVKTKKFTFNSPIAYDKIVLPESNVIDIISVNRIRW